MTEGTFCITKYFTSVKGFSDPKSLFSDVSLRSINGPVVFLTGVGVRAEVWEEHDCDCEFCALGDWIQVEKNFLSKNELENFIKRGNPDVKVKGEIFWVKAVRQQSFEAFELRSTGCSKRVIE